MNERGQLSPGLMSQFALTAYVLFGPRRHPSENRSQMVHFSPSDPFPLVDLTKHTQSELRAHSARVDRWLGLRTLEIEGQLAERGCRERAPSSCGESQELWLGLDVQALLTPYCEIRAILERLRPNAGDTVIDLGAAYGRMAFVIERHFPGVRFVGYEYVGERAREGRRAFNGAGLKRSRLEHADLAAGDFQPEDAQIYFIYDYGTPKAIEKTLYDLRRRSQESPAFVVCRGRHSRYLISNRHPWLKSAFPGEPEGVVTIYHAHSSPRVDLAP